MRFKRQSEDQPKPRRRWVWGIFSLALLGGVWAWWAGVNSAVRTDFNFLNDAELADHLVVGNADHWTYVLEGNPDALLIGVKKELSERGFQPVPAPTPDRFWSNGRVKIMVIPFQPSSARAASPTQSFAAGPKNHLGELSITISRPIPESLMDVIRDAIDFGGFDKDER